MPYTTITSAAYNAFVNDVASAITQSIAVTGQTPMTAALNLGGFAINNVGSPVVGTDAVNLQTLQGGSPGGFVNRLRNGTFDVWQRGLSALPAGFYVADGWIVQTAGTTLLSGASNGRLLTLRSMTVYGAAGNTDMVIQQRVESLVAAPLTSQQVTLQMWVYNATAASVTPRLSTYHCTSTADIWTGSTLDLNGVALQPCAAGQWTRVAYTWAMTASAALGIAVLLDFGAQTSASISITEADLRATPGLPVGLTAAASIPTPELRPVHEETLFCQRYYQRWQNSVANGAFCTGVFTSPTNFICTLPLQTQMRGGVTLAFTSSPAASFSIYPPGVALSAIVSATQGGFVFQLTATTAGGGPIGYAGYLYCPTAGQFLALSAEL